MSGDWIGTSERTGAACLNVRCEKCGRHYHYFVLRTASGAAETDDEDSAGDRADALAQSRLIRALETVEVVPCPACGWVQADMVAEARRRVGRPFTWLAGLLALLGAGPWIWCQVARVSVLDFEIAPEQSHWINGIALAGIVAAAAVLLLRAALRARVDPNAGYPKWPRPIPGALTGIPGRAPPRSVGRRIV